MTNSKYFFYISFMLLFSPLKSWAQNGCNVTWTTSNSSITINGLNSPHTIMKLFTPDWNIHTECFDDCQSPTTISGLSQGTYHLSYDLYDANWQKICNDLVDVNVSGGGNSNQPDLTVSNLSINGSGKAGDTISYSFNLNNIGNDVAQGDYQIKAYLSTDNQWSSDDALAGYVDTGNTPIGTIANVNAAITVPNIVAGNYFLILIADSENVINESNESNNVTFTPFMVKDDGETNTASCGFKKENIWKLLGNCNASTETSDSYVFYCEQRNDQFQSEEVVMTIDKMGNLSAVEVLGAPENNRFVVTINSTNEIIIKYKTSDLSTIWTANASLPFDSKYTSFQFVVGSGIEVYDGFLVAGTIAATTGIGVTDLLQFSIKLNTDGNVVVRNVLGKDVIGGEYYFTLKQNYSTHSGYVCVVLQSNLLSFVKFNESGLLLWKSPFASDLPSNHTQKIEMSRNEESIYAANTDNNQPKVIKVNAVTGEKIYEKNVNGSNADTGNILGLISDSDGTVVLSIREDVFSQSGQLVYKKLDANGNQIWEHKMSTMFNFIPTQSTADGGYLFFGKHIARVGGNKGQVGVMKTTEDGALTPDCGNSGNGTGNTLACDMQYTTTNTSLSIFGSGMNQDHVNIQIFDPNWTTVFACNDDCGNQVDLSGLLSNQTYHVKITTYATNASGGWELVCDKLKDVTLEGGNGGGGNSDKADLTITNLQTTDGKAGDVVPYTFDLNNIGTSVANGDYVINAYLSTDNQWSTNDAFAGVVNTGNTPIGTISNVNASITIPNLDAGNYYLILKADANDDIDESNENNNVVANTISILSNTSNGTCGFRNENFINVGWTQKIVATENSNGFQLSTNISDEFSYSHYVFNIDHNGDFVSQNSTDVNPNNHRVKTFVNRSTGELTIQFLVNDVIQWETKTILNPGSGLTFADVPNVSGVKVFDGVLVAGTVVGIDATTGTDYLKQFTIKLNQSGVILNDHVFDEGTISGDYFFFIKEISNIESTDMGYFVRISNPSEIFLGKFSQTGEFLWRTKLAADLPSNASVQFIQSVDKQFVYYSNINNGYPQITKVNASTGEVLYKKNVGEILDLGVTYASDFSGVLPTQDGGLVTFFSSGDIGGETPIKVYGKIDANGNKVWQHVIETESLYKPILETEDGSFLFVGQKRLLQIPNIHWSLSVMKVTSDGDLTPDCGGGNGGGNGNQTSIACDVNYTISGSNISFTGNADHISIQIFNHNWSQTVYSCSDNCNEGFDIGNLNINEQYHVKVTTYNSNANGGWELICEELMDVVFNTPTIFEFRISNTKNIQPVDYGVLYPNPAKDIVYLKLNDFIGQSAKISIVNSLGQIVKQQNIVAINNPIRMDLSDLQIGIYQVLIDVAYEAVFVKKLMIVK